jgi:hypothetical protein
MVVEGKFDNTLGEISEDCKVWILQTIWGLVAHAENDPGELPMHF